jgi:hypothetical protein
MLLVSLDCILLIATSVFCIVFLFCLSSFRLVFNVACISEFSIIDFLFTTQQTGGKVNYRQSRDTGNIGHTTHTRTTIKAKEQHSKLCAQCCLYLRIFYYWLSLLFAVLFLCFDCRPSVSCVPNVACISGLFIIDCHLSMTVNNRQSRDTGNIGHTRHRRTTIKAKEQHNKQKWQSIIENPEIQATLSTRLLPVSLDSLLLTFPSVCCVVPLLSLSSFRVLCAQCCLYLLIVYYWLPLQFSVLC